MASAPDSAAAAQLQLQCLRERFLAGLHGLAPLCAQARALEDTAAATAPSPALLAALDTLRASLATHAAGSGPGESPAGAGTGGGAD